MSWKYSITLSTFRELEPLDKSLENLNHQGFDTVEVYGEPDLIDVKNISNLLGSFSMEVSGVTGMWGLSNSGYKLRNIITTNNDSFVAAQNYIKKCIVLCHTLGGNTFNICLFSDVPLISDGNHKVLLREEKRKLVTSFIKPIRHLAKYAGNYGVELLIEPLNRYSTPICTDSEDAKYIVDLVNEENLGILLDTFHMNIEEDSIYDAIINSNTLLKHVHMSDNNRKMPGFGHIDFESVTKALKKIKYSRFLTFEPTIQNTCYKDDIMISLQYLKNLSKH
ncbi:MAG TPA: sugar phosphate isomerase/epimerase family protein [Nitrososphaeraceae archaeon]|jgi:sugar phosphate isomerase/epimerase